MRTARCPVGLLALCCVACAPTREPLAAAQHALDRAGRLDAQLEAATDPTAVESERDAALEQARALFQQVLATQPDLPEAQLGQAAVLWRADHDLPGAFQLVDAVIGELAGLDAAQLSARRESGQTAAQLLARAYAERASYLLSRYLEPDPTGPPIAAPPTVPEGPLQQATADLDRALELDPQPDYEFLRRQVDQLSQPAAPLDPAGLGTVPVSP